MDEIAEPLAASLANLASLHPEDERIKKLDIHLKTGDYFAMLVHIMSFIEDTLASAPATNAALKERELKLLADIKKDLLYLHEHYQILPKSV